MRKISFTVLLLLSSLIANAQNGLVTRLRVSKTSPPNESCQPLSGAIIADGNGNIYSCTGVNTWTMMSTDEGDPTTFDANGTPLLSNNPINFQNGTNISITNPSNGNVTFSLTGTINGSQLPFPSLTTLGGVQATNAVSHQWIGYIDTSGIAHLTQPSCSDLSNAATSCATDATNATNITAGTLTTSVDTPSLTLSGITGTTQCLHVDSTGLVSGTGADCGTGGGGGGSVTQVNPATGSGSINNLGVFGFANQTTTPTLTVVLSNSPAHSFFGNNTGSTAVPNYFQPSCSDLSNGVASCSTDTTNAANISSGTLNTSRLPAVVNVATGFEIGGAAASGHYLRGNGTNYVDSTIQTADVPTLNQNTTGNAASATNLAGGAVGSVPYQGVASTTVFLSGNTAATDQVLVSHGTGSVAQAPTLSNAPALSAANMTGFPTLNQNTTGTAANLSGTPALPNGTTATTQTALNNSTKLATTAYTDVAVSVETSRAETVEALLSPLASPTFTGTVTTPALKVSGVTGSTQCLHVSTLGVVSGTGSDCGSGSGSGTVTQVNPATGAGTATNLGTFGFATQTTTPTLTISLATAGAHTFFGNNTGTTAAPNYLQPACADLSNASASCSTDATNATNISSGTLATGRLPAIINITTGFQIGGAAASGHYLRGNATNYVDSAIQVADVPTLNQNTTGSAATATTATNVAGGAIGAVPYQSAANTTAMLSGNTAATDQVVVSHGTGTVAQAPMLSNSPALSATNMTGFPTLNQNTTGTASNLSGTPALPNGTTATTQTALDNSTKLGTTAYADTAVGVEKSRALAAEGLLAPLASPTFTGTTTVPALTLSGILSVTQCLHVNSVGVVSGTGSDCGTGSGGGGTVTQVNPATGVGTATNFGTFGFATPTTTPTLTISLTASPAHSFFGNNTGTPAAPNYLQPACADLSNASASCATDATNATNIGSGTLNTARLPSVINIATGFEIGSAAASGHYLRGNATNYVDSTIQVADVPTLNQSTTGNAATATTSTNIAGGTVGSVPYQSAANTTLFLAGNTAATDQVVVSHGTGSSAQAPTLSNAPALSAASMTSFPTLNQNTTGNAATATALAATPTLCSTGSAPTGVLVSGNATGCAPFITNPMTAIGDTIYGGASGVPTKLAGNTAATDQVLVSHGTGSVAQAPTLSNAPALSAANMTGFPTFNQNTTGYASVWNSWSSSPGSPANYAHGYNTTYGDIEYYDGALFQRILTQADEPVPQSPQSSSIGASVGAIHQYATVPTNILFIGDSQYAGVFSAGLAVPENAVAFFRNKIQAAQGNAGPGFVSPCNSVAESTCFKKPDPPGTSITSTGSWLHEWQLVTASLGTPIGLDSTDIYNTSAGVGTLTFKCNYCSEMLIFFKNITGEGTFTCTIDGSATGACSGTINAATSTNPWVDTGSLSYLGGHTVVLTVASGTIHNAGAYMWITGKRGVIVTNIALGSASAANNNYPFATYPTQTAAMLGAIAPSAVVIGASGSNECTQSISVATFATNLHTLYTSVVGVVGANVPIIFATAPDEVSPCTTLALYEQAIRNEALTDGTRVVDVYQRYSPFTKVRTMLPGGNTCYSTIEPHLTNQCADDVADMFMQFMPKTNTAQSLGFNVGFGDFGGLATWKQATGITQYHLIYNNGGLASTVGTGMTTLSPSSLIGSCIGNCGTLAKDTDICEIANCPITFDSTGGTSGDLVVVSTTTTGDVLDTGSASEPGSCLLVVGSVKNPPPSGGGIGIVDLTRAHLSAACGSGSGTLPFSSLTPGNITAATSSIFGFGTNSHLDLDQGCDPGTCLKMPMDTANFAIASGYVSWDSNTGVNQLVIGRGVATPFRIPFTSNVQPASGNCAQWSGGTGQIADGLQACNLLPVHKATTVTLDCTYVGQLVYASGTDAPTYTLPTSICPNGTSFGITNASSGTVTIATSLSVNGSTSGFTLATNQWIYLFSNGTNWEAVRFDSTNSAGTGVSSLAATAPLHVSASTGAVTATIQNSAGVTVTAVPDIVYSADSTVTFTSGMSTGCFGGSVTNIVKPTAATRYRCVAQVSQSTADSGCSTHGQMTVGFNWIDNFNGATISSTNNVLFRLSEASAVAADKSAMTAGSTLDNTVVYRDISGQEIYDAANGQVSFCPAVSVAAVGCTTYPVFKVDIRCMQE